MYKFITNFNYILLYFIVIFMIKPNIKKSLIVKGIKKSTHISMH